MLKQTGSIQYLICNSQVHLRVKLLLVRLMSWGPSGWERQSLPVNWLQWSSRGSWRKLLWISTSFPFLSFPFFPLCWLWSTVGLAGWMTSSLLPVKIVKGCSPREEWWDVYKMWCFMKPWFSTCKWERNNLCWNPGDGWLGWKDDKMRGGKYNSNCITQLYSTLTGLTLMILCMWVCWLSH